MNEEKNVNSAPVMDTCYEEFAGPYSDKVHVIGRVTMAIAAVLSFLPILYLYFVKGYKVPLSDYVVVFTTICMMRIGYWISEPFTWFPVVGAAPLYMAYFAGNCKNLRVPVAQNLQSKYDVDVMTPKGQIITTIGVGVSVFVNVALLVVIVLLGNVIIPLFPPAVLSTFDYVIPALLGAMISNHVRRRGLVKTVLWTIPGLVILAMVKAGMIRAMYGNSFAIGLTVLVGYIVFVIQGKMEDKKK